MNSRVKLVIKYFFLVLLTGGLLWYSFNNIEVKEGQTRVGFLLDMWNKADKIYLWLCAFVSILAHWLRGQMWVILLRPMGYNISSTNSFLSVMVGYFINLAVPRGGEVSRCYNLYRLEKVPVNIALGSVIAERIIDVILLAIFLSCTFLIEFDSLMGFFSSLNYGNSSSPVNGLLIMGIFVLGFIAVALIIAYLFYKLKPWVFIRLFIRVRVAAKGVKQGMLAVFKVKNKPLFFTYTISIWLCYMLQTYTVMQAFDDTAPLGILGAISIFTIGGIAMTVPLPGGMGSYHLLIPLALQVLYGISKDVSTGYAFILHGWQTLTVIIVGAIALVYSQIKADKINK